MICKPLYLLIPIFLVVSCQREQEWEGAPDINATVESEQNTRTSLSVDESGAGTIYWNPSDQIDVFFGTKKAQYTSQNASEAIAATFKTNATLTDSDVSSTNIWGLYPSNSSSSCNGSSITTTLPSTQYGVPNTFDQNIFPAVAHSSSKNLQFYNVCGGIKFNLAYDDIKKITFRGNNNENLAGKVSISFVDGLPKATIVNGVKEITLTPKTGTTFTKGKDYYFILLPVTLSAGFTMTFTATDGTTGTLNYTDKSVTITRSIFGRKGNVDAYASFIDYRQANSVIYYTSSNGQVVTPYRTGVFGANIISNEYVGNRGVITFDGEVTSIGRYAFYNRSGLTSIELPASVSVIDQYAFYNCSGLTSITVNSRTPPTLGSDAFSLTYCPIYAPEGSVSDYKSFWSVYADRIQMYCPKNVIYYTTEGSNPVTPYNPQAFGARIVSNSYVGQDYYYVDVERMEYSRGRKWKLTFDGEVTNIGEWAFYGCDDLRSITLPNSVTSIGDNAFQNCRYLNRITIPESVHSMGNGLFTGCYNLKSIVILNPTPPSVSYGTFGFQSEMSMPSDFYYHIFVPKGSVSAYQTAANWSQSPGGSFNWTSRDVIYPILPFIASHFHIPSYYQSLYIDLDQIGYYICNILEGISIWDDGDDSNPILQFNGSYPNARWGWSDGNGYNGIPSGLNAWEFYHFRLVNLAFSTYSLPEDIRNRIYFNEDNWELKFDNTREGVTGTYEFPFYIEFTSMFPFEKPFTVNVVLRGKDVTQPHEAVDLGLSVKWATCNVGADTPEGYGDYFAWGETELKSNYSWSTYEWGNGSHDMTKYCNDSSFGYNGFTDNKTVLDLEDDAAHVNWGGSWRMPTDAEWAELCRNCTWTWATQNGVNGYRVTSKKTGYTDKSIFLPAAGLWDNTDLYNVGTIGYYWTSPLYTESPDNAWCVDFDSGDCYFSGDIRFIGFSVRPVSE